MAIPIKKMLLILVIVSAAVTPSFAVTSLPPENPKYQKIKRVYENVARAFGDGRLPPRLVVNPTGTKERMVIAWSDAGSGGNVGVTGTAGDLQDGYIAIDERVYDLFALQCPDPEGALAFIIGHELAHYYLRHGWVGDFGNSFAALDVGKKMLKAASYDDIVRRETEADYFGGFYGYVAGYDTLGAASVALDVLYTDYQLPEKVSNYPARMDRKAIADRAKANLRKMIPVFDAANRLLLLEKYHEAAHLYSYLARLFPSREMFNNCGVAYALEALRASANTVQFAYPFEFDAETRLRIKKGKTKNVDVGADEKANLLRMAGDAFDKALQRDREYATAKVNLAAVNSLLGDNDTAVVLANQALALLKTTAEPLTLTNALVVRGIAYATAGNRERALVDFAAARNSGSPHAALNLVVVSRGKFEASVAREQEMTESYEEMIAGISPRKPFTKDPDVVTFTLQAAGEGPALAIHARSGDGWERTLILIGQKAVSIVATSGNYEGSTTRGIGIGASLKSVKERYGEASRVVPARQMTWHVYRRGHIAFSINQEGKVAGWLNYWVD